MNYISYTIDYLITSIGSLGYFGIFLLMAIESTIFPLPSELVIIPAGYLAYQGQLSILLIVISSTLGSIIGSLVMYYLALFIGRKSFEKFFMLRSDKVTKLEAYFKRHGEITVFISRLIPVVRHLISIPAGFSKMNVKRFILFTAIGSAIWSLLLAFLGYYLGTLVAQSNFKLVTILLISFCLIIIILYIIVNKFLSRKK